MKKSLAVFLAVFLALSIAGCGETSSSQSDPATPASAAVPASTVAPESAVEGWKKQITLSDGSVYPKGAVTFIAPFSAGGSVDLGIRLFSKYAEKHTDATMIVENITGGSGLTGIQAGLTRNPDGYTLWHIDDGPQYISTAVSTCPFNVITDMVPIGQMVADDRVFVVSPNETRFTNAEEMIAYAKDHPGDLTISTSGSGTIASLIVNYLTALTGAEFNIIGYSGSAEAKAAFLGGHVDIMSAGVSEAAPLVAEKTGKVILEIAEKAVYEGAQTIGELGHKDAVLLSTNRGLALSSKVDPAIISYWSEIMTMVCEDPEYLAEAKAMNLLIRHRTSDEFLEQMSKDFAAWEPIKIEAGL